MLGSGDQEQGASGKKKQKNSNEEEEAEEWTDKAFAVQPDLPVQCTKSEYKEKATQPPKSYIGRHIAQSNGECRQAD